MRLLFLGAAGLSIVISVAIVLSLLGNALYFLINVDKGALFTDGWFPRRGMYDIATIVAGTLSSARSPCWLRRRSAWAPRSTSPSTRARASVAG